MKTFLENLEMLSLAAGTSGDEAAVKKLIYDEVISYPDCVAKTDNAGNLIVTKKGKKEPPTQWVSGKTQLFRRIRNECDVSCSLDSYCKLSLMLCASTCDSSGKNLCTLGYKATKLCNILIIYEFNLIGTELADLTYGLSVSMRSIISFSFNVVKLL